MKNAKRPVETPAVLFQCVPLEDVEWDDHELVVVVVVVVAEVVFGVVVVVVVVVERLVDTFNVLVEMFAKLDEMLLRLVDTPVMLDDVPARLDDTLAVLEDAVLDEAELEEMFALLGGGLRKRSTRCRSCSPRWSTSLKPRCWRLWFRWRVRRCPTQARARPMRQPPSRPVAVSPHR